MDADEAAAPLTYSLFSGAARVATGDLATISVAARDAAKRDHAIVVFANSTGRIVDIDLRDPPPMAASPRAEPKTARASRGRPKLGVVPREVTLLPRHWDWLQAEPGGASAAIRRLVDQARRDSLQSTRRRDAREAAHRVMTVLAGNLEGYEDALRALYDDDQPTFDSLIAAWPRDVRAFVQELAASGWPADDGDGA